MKKSLKKIFLTIPVMLMTFSIMNPLVIYADESENPAIEQTVEGVDVSQENSDEIQPELEEIEDVSNEEQNEQINEAKEITEPNVEENNQVIQEVKPSESLVMESKQESVETAVKEELNITEAVQNTTLTPKLSRATEEQVNRYIKPDFKNQLAYGSLNPYTASWTGQCTWFTWGRFYEVYGYSPGFTGNGCDCVLQLITAHSDKWYLSATPVIGSVFSADKAHNYVGMIVGMEDDLYIIQEGNLNGRNDTLDEVETDCWTQTYTLDELRSCYGNVIFANPKNAPDESKLRVDHVSPELKDKDIMFDSVKITRKMMISNKRKKYL